MQRALLLIAVLVVVRVVTGAALGLSEDEALYWVFGQRLDLGYFDHPPMIAWLIRLSTELVGDSELGVRLLPGLVGGAAVALLLPLTQRPLLVAVVVGAMPLMLLGGVLATPDVPLLGAWALGLFAAERRNYGLLGVAAGLAMLSKYTGALLLPLLVFAEPRTLRQRGPWVAFAVAVAVYAPNAFWNLNHDMVSWRFQLAHVGQEARRLDFLGAQVGLATPILFFAFVGWWATAWRGDRVERLCWWSSLPVFLLGVYAGGEANWSAPAYLGPAVGLAYRGGRWARAGWVGAGLAGVLSLIVLVHAHRPLFSIPKDPLHRLQYGPVLADSVAAWGIDDVYTSRYQEAALIHFYSGVEAHAYPGIGRADQYDLWPVDLANHALFVRPTRGSAATAADADYSRRSGPHIVTAFAHTSDPLVDVPIGRWQVFEMWR